MNNLPFTFSGGGLQAEGHRIVDTICAKSLDRGSEVSGHPDTLATAYLVGEYLSSGRALPGDPILTPYAVLQFLPADTQFLTAIPAQESRVCDSCRNRKGIA